MKKQGISIALILVLVMSIMISNVSASVTVYGDIDGNGVVSSSDALEILKGVVGKRFITGTESTYADVDGDSSISANDALLILKKVVDKIKIFPVENDSVKNVLIVALEPYFYPYSWEDNENFYGLHVDIATELAQRNGFTVKFVSAEWDELFIGIKNGAYNLVLGITPTESRKELFINTPVSFTDEYYDGMAALINLDEFNLSYSEGNKFKNTISEMVYDGTIESYLAKYGLINANLNSYEYLKEWVIANGCFDGDDITYTISEDSTTEYAISYSQEYDNLYVWYINSLSRDVYAYSSLYLDDYFYGFSFYGDRIYGYVNAPYYTNNTKLTYVSSDCTIYTESEMLSLAKSSVDLLVESLRLCLLTNDLPLTIADLGFESY